MPWKANVKYLQPKIDFMNIKRLWFIHAGVVYPVPTAPAIVFQNVVLAQAPKWQDHTTYGPILSQVTLDLHDRWFLLTSLIDKGCGVPLFASRELAEKACAEQVAGS
jgi:hypothetical protein